MNYRYRIYYQTQSGSWYSAGLFHKENLEDNIRRIFMYENVIAARVDDIVRNRTILTETK